LSPLPLGEYIASRRQADTMAFMGEGDFELAQRNNIDCRCIGNSI